MIALALRSMAQRKLRAALTAVAVLLGVAMIAGTYVQTDQITSAFEDIQQTANAGVDVVVTPREAFTGDWSQPEPLRYDTFRAIHRVEGIDRMAGELWETGALVVGGKTIQSDFAPSGVVSDVPEPFNPFRPVRGTPSRRARRGRGRHAAGRGRSGCGSARRSGSRRAPASSPSASSAWSTTGTSPRSAVPR